MSLDWFWIVGGMLFLLILVQFGLKKKAKRSQTTVIPKSSPSPQQKLEDMRHQFQLLAEQGNLEAMYRIAKLHHYGQHGIHDPDFNSARKMYRKLKKASKNSSYYNRKASEGLYKLDIDEFGDSNETIPSLPQHMSNAEFKTPDAIPILSDPDNVHDDIVRDNVRNALTRLRFELEGAPSSWWKDDTKVVAELSQWTKQNANATQVLQTMSLAGQIPGMDLTEIQVVGLVIAYMQTNNVNDIPHKLVTALAACWEHGQIVCQEGRVAHILDLINVSFLGTSKQVKILPTWALRRELMERASYLLNAFHKEHNREPNSEELKSTLLNDFIKTYVQQGVISQDTLHLELSQWLGSV